MGSPGTSAEESKVPPHFCQFWPKDSLWGLHYNGSMRKIFVGTLLGAVVWAAQPAQAALDPKPAKGGIQKVVIDPGHGGAEDGAIGPAGTKEKDLVLDMARRLAALLRALEFEVVLTREGDIDLGLDDRAAVANRERADLFLSLHANASRSSKARGAETFFLSPEAVDDEERAIAALENGTAPPPPPGQTDQNLPLILWDLAQTQHLEESSRLAQVIQEKLNAALGLQDRGVRQAPFRVLVGATMPAVLVEIGFLTNAEEETRLNDAEYRRKLAEALSLALQQWRNQTSGRVKR